MSDSIYGIMCDGGPKKRTVKVGDRTVNFAANSGRVFFFPEERAFKFQDNYCFKSRKEAMEHIKDARECRVRMFLPYDGFSICKIVKEVNQ